jgi:hypothetical protein
VKLTDEKANSGTNVQTYLAREKRLRLITWATTIFPLAVFLALISLTVRQENKFQKLRQQNADLSNRNDTLTSQISDNQNKLDKMKADIGYYASVLTPSVSISFANEGQRSKASAVAEQLKKLGYDATVDNQPMGKRISQNSYVRYFFGSDLTLAQKVQEQAKSMGIPAQIQSFAEIDEEDREALGYIRPKALELWLGQRYVPHS